MRCDGNTPVCSPCVERDRRCIFPSAQKVRGPGKSKRRIETLEARLAAMESMLLQDSRKGPPVVDESPSPPQPDLGKPDAVEPNPGEPGPSESISRPSMPMSIFNRRISERFTLWQRQREDYTKPLERINLSLMEAESAELFLVEETLSDMCAELPFVRAPWLIEQLGRPNAFEIPDAWWQGLSYAVIANAIMYRTHKNAFRQVAPYAWQFFRNAYAVLPELIIQADSIGAAQAVMGMVMFMRQSADTRAASMLLSIAVRMQQTAGMHVGSPQQSPISADDEEHRIRVFWATFILDMEMAINTGLPATHPQRNVAVELPAGSDVGETIFRLRAELAKIQLRIAAQLPDSEEEGLLALESELEAWRLQVPLEIRPNWSDQLNSNTGENMDLSVAILHLVYYNSLCMVCWVSVRHVTVQMRQTSELLPGGAASGCMMLDERTSHHRNLARATARAVIRTMSQFRTQSFQDTWRVLSYPLSASIALLAIICKEPAHSEAHVDVSLLSWFVRFLDRMTRDEGCDLERMRDGICRFEMVASDAFGVAVASAMPVNPALWPLTLASGQTGQVSLLQLHCLPRPFLRGLSLTSPGNLDPDDMFIVSSHVSGTELHGKHTQSRHRQCKETCRNPGGSLGRKWLWTLCPRLSHPGYLWVCISLWHWWLVI